MRIPKSRLFLLPFIIIGLNTAATEVWAQGELTPPGAPQETMKTLSQIEPRTDVAKLAGDANSHHIITQPGSYYLSANILATKTRGVEIRASGVTLDLNGFQIYRTTPDFNSMGVLLESDSHRVIVKNGSISGFETGLVGGTNPRGGVALQLSVHECQTGIHTGPGWIIKDCTFYHNTRGINAGEGTLITDCNANENYQDGIYANDSSVINCIASSNGRYGIAVSIHDGGTGTSIINCTVRGNEYGIVSSGATITGCNAYQNSSAGIMIGSDCLVKDNNSHDNSGAGIRSYTSDFPSSERSDNRIEGNNVNNNSIGLHITGSGATDNLIINNSASGNSTNYQIDGGNKVGPVVAAPNSGAINGSTGGAGVGSTDPFANISY